MILGMHSRGGGGHCDSVTTVTKSEQGGGARCCIGFWYPTRY